MDKSRQTRLLRVLKTNMGVTDYHYYQNLKRIDFLADRLEKLTRPEDRLLNLGSGAFLLECVLEDRGYKHLTAVDVDDRLASIHEQLVQSGFLQHTKFEKLPISEFRSTETYEFITMYDCAYYPKNNLIEMLPQLTGLLSQGAYFFFDAYDLSVYQRIKPVYDRIRSKYRNRTMYDFEQLNTALNENGLAVIEVKAELGSKTVLAKVFLSLGFALTGRALLVNYLVRKNRLPS